MRLLLVSVCVNQPNTAGDLGYTFRLQFVSPVPTHILAERSDGQEKNKPIPFAVASPLSSSLQ